MSPERMINVEALKNHIPSFDTGKIELEGSEKEKKEALFKAILVSELHDVLKRSMEDADLDEEAGEEFFALVSHLSDEDALAVMAIPHELQERIFGSFAKRLKEGKIDGKGFLDQLQRNADKFGYKMGFHLSNRDITEVETIEHGQPVKKWDVDGTEEDHRDNDLKRAYYSLDYLNLYRKKSGNYLYLVRAETGPNSSHRTDNDGSWGRASKLPIVAKLNIHEIDQKIDEIMGEMKTEKKN